MSLKETCATNEGVNGRTPTAALRQAAAAKPVPARIGGGRLVGQQVVRASWWLAPVRIKQMRGGRQAKKPGIIWGTHKTAGVYVPWQR